MHSSLSVPQSSGLWGNAGQNEAGGSAGRAPSRLAVRSHNMYKGLFGRL